MWVGRPCVFCVEWSVYLVVITKSYVCSTQKTCYKFNAMSVKTLLHQNWSQMKAQIFEEKYKIYRFVISITAYIRYDFQESR